MIRALLASVLGEEQGHGLAEYCLITALVALAALGLYVHLSGGVQDLWGTAGSTLATGSTASGGGSGTSVSSH